MHCNSLKGANGSPFAIAIIHLVSHRLSWCVVHVIKSCLDWGLWLWLVAASKGLMPHNVAYFMAHCKLRTGNCAFIAIKPALPACLIMKKKAQRRARTTGRQTDEWTGRQMSRAIKIAQKIRHLFFHFLLPFFYIDSIYIYAFIQIYINVACGTRTFKALHQPNYIWCADPN